MFERNNQRCNTRRRENIFLEYLKDYKGTVIGKIHDDWFGNIFDVFLAKNISELDDSYTWNSFKEAKKKLEGKENPSSKCFPLKK